MFLTEAEFTDIYGAISAQDFNILRAKAEAEADYVTFGRITHNWDKLDAQTITRIKSAVAELIYEMSKEPQESDRVVKTESVGSHSVTYETESPTRTYRDVLTRHLIHTGLMYRGALYGF